MRAAVFCPGPSLKEWKVDELSGAYELNIAVNRAAEIVRARWWVMLDAATFEITRWHRPLPVVVCASSVWNQVVATRCDARRFQHEDHLAWDSPDKRSLWHTKGITVAMVLAARLGAREIDVYGCDWQGVQDFDGRSFGCQKRSPERWAQERAIFESVAGALAGDGVLVRRLQPPGDRGSLHAGQEVSTDLSRTLSSDVAPAPNVGAVAASPGRV